MPKTFFVSLKALIPNSDGKVLLLTKEKAGKQYWDLPGGRIEGTDSFEECLKRELSEELGIKGEIHIEKQIGDCWELPSEFVEEGNRQLIVFFLVKTKINDLKISDEHINYTWLSRLEFISIKEKEPIMLDGYKRALAEIFS